MEPLSMALMAGGSLLGGLFGSKGQTQKQSPWKPQQGYLKDIFANAQNIYNNRGGPYTGDLYAGMSGMTQDGISGIGSFSPYGQNAAMGMLNAGSGLYGAGNAAMGSANALANMGMSDPTQANISAASQYANSPYIQGSIDAANRDTARALYEGQLPAIERGGSMSGNTNSTRTGVEAAIARRGANDRMADTSAAIRSDAYNRGLSMAEGARTANMGAMANAGGMFGNIFGQGVNAATMGQQNMYNNLDALVKAGQLSQQDAQGYLDQAFNKWNMADNYDAQKLTQYQAAVSGNYGGSTTNSGPGVAAGMLGGAAAGLGLYNNYMYPQGAKSN